MADQQVDLANRVQLLEKLFGTHLGPQFAASSMNIPHPDMVLDTSLAALTARVVLLETAVTTLQASVATLQTQMTAAQAAIITTGRYN